MDGVLRNLQVRAASSHLMNQSDSKETGLNRHRRFLLAEQKWLKMRNV